jgi:hypothetical protein
MAKFLAAGVRIEPVWIKGEYAWDIDQPSFFLVGERFLVRHAPDEGDGDDWYACNSVAGAEELKTLELPTEIA